MKELTMAEKYAALIGNQIALMFEEGSENYIDLSTLADDDNCTEFIHAMANLVPTLFYNRFTEEPINMLQFNHLANQLIFQNKK